MVETQKPLESCWARRKMSLKRAAIVLMVFVLFGCAAQSGLLVEIAPKPESYSWWLRANFQPKGTRIQGIPVADINSSWRYANEFESGAFPDVSLGERLEKTMDRTETSFTLAMSPGGVARRVSLGIYERWNGERGTFLLYLAQTEQGAFTLIGAEEISRKPEFAVLMSKGAADFEVWWCYYCDVSSRYRWNGLKGRYEPD